MEKYGTDGQTADDDIIRRMRFVCWINTAIDMHLEYAIVIGFSTPTVVTRKHLSVKVNTYIACLGVFFNHEISQKVTKQVETYRLRSWQFLLSIINFIERDTHLMQQFIYYYK